MKGQPLAYNKDNQEDKEPLFDALDTLKDCLTAMLGMLPHLDVRADRMREAASLGFATATDLADYLVRKDVPVPRRTRSGRPLRRPRGRKARRAERSDVWRNCSASAR